MRWCRRRWSCFIALLYKKHPKLYRQRIQPQPPWRYYLANGALLTAVGAAAVGSASMALDAGLLWACWTGMFCMRRLGNTSRTPRRIAEMILTSPLIPPLAVYCRLRGALRFRVWFL